MVVGGGMEALTVTANSPMLDRPAQHGNRPAYRYVQGRQWSGIHCILFGSPMLWRPIGPANGHRNDALDTADATCLALI
jgi:hypothetical protein